MLIDLNRSASYEGGGRQRVAGAGGAWTGGDCAGGLVGAPASGGGGGGAILTLRSVARSGGRSASGAIPGYDDTANARGRRGGATRRREGGRFASPAGADGAGSSEVGANVLAGFAGLGAGRGASASAVGVAGCAIGAGAGADGLERTGFGTEASAGFSFGAGAGGGATFGTVSRFDAAPGPGSGERAVSTLSRPAALVLASLA